MIRCSIKESLTGPAWVCTMNTSLPRIDVPKRQWISPLANSRRLASPSSTPSCWAISWASSGWDRPETSSRRRWGVNSMPANLPRPGAGIPGRRAHPGAGRHLGALTEDGERPDPGVGPDHRPAAHAGGHHGALPDRGVHQPGVRTDLGVLADRTGPLQDDTGQEHHVGAQLHIDVDVGRLGSHMVPPRRIHRSLIRSRSSASATASWARSLTPATSMVSATTTEPTRCPAS